MTDEELVRLAQRELPHRNTAFEVLAGRYYARVRSLAMGIVADRDDAETVAQDAMVRAYHALPNLDQPDRFWSWLATIVVNRSRSHLDAESRERRKTEALALDPTYQESVDSEEGSDTSRIELDRLLNHLTVEERTLLAFRLVDELEFQEIAQILNLNLSTTKMRYYRALRKLEPLAARQ